MSNKSTILPGTTHVHIPVENYLGNSEHVQWCVDNSAGRVDVFTYETDDCLDHHHLLAVIQGVITTNWLAPSASAIANWIMMLDENGTEATILFAFEDHAAALLFKLAFGGAA